MWNRTEAQVNMALIRHGETAANRERRYLGRTDESLSEEGIMALMAYRRQKRYPAVEHLFVSPMKRCLETAAVIYPELPPVVIPEWTEMDFGEFEYKNYGELKDDARYQAWIDSGGTLRFPGGEDRAEFMLRCERGLDRMCSELQGVMRRHAGKTVRVGVVAHGGTIMALLDSHAVPKGSLTGTGDYFGYQTANGGGFVCRMNGAGRIRLEEVEKL